MSFGTSSTTVTGFKRSASTQSDVGSVGSVGSLDSADVFEAYVSSRPKQE
jgi:hypothetical protein